MSIYHIFTKSRYKVSFVHIICVQQMLMKTSTEVTEITSKMESWHLKQNQIEPDGII